MRKDKEATRQYAKTYYVKHRNIILQRAKDFYNKLREDAKKCEE